MATFLRQIIEQLSLNEDAIAFDIALTITEGWASEQRQQAQIAHLQARLKNLEDNARAHALALRNQEVQFEESIHTLQRQLDAINEALPLGQLAFRFVQCLEYAVRRTQSYYDYGNLREFRNNLKMKSSAKRTIAFATSTALTRT